MRRSYPIAALCFFSYLLILNGWPWSGIVVVFFALAYWLAACTTKPGYPTLNAHYCAGCIDMVPVKRDGTCADCGYQIMSVGNR